MRKKKYEKLKDLYPAYISLDQLYKICNIAKRSAAYLLEHGIVPCEDTGKKTWRYRIALDDVIVYLRRREQWGSMIPPGAVSSRGKHAKNTRRSFGEIVTSGHENEIASYFSYIYSDYADVLTAVDLAEMTGLNKKTVLLMLKAGEIESMLVSGKYLIPKPYLLEFVTTQRYIDSKSNSDDFKRILGGFEIWKTAKS